MYLLPEGMTMADVRRMDAELLASEGLDLAAFPTTGDATVSAVNGEAHSIEFVPLPTWQGGALALARCVCGWESQRTEEAVVNGEVERHLASQGDQGEMQDAR